MVVSGRSADTASLIPAELGVPVSLCTGPVRRPQVIDRPHVVERLLDSADVAIVVVDAPAGYGKSTAIGLWTDADERKFAWVRLDELDDDPVHLVRHIAASLHAVVPVTPTLIRELTTAGRLFDAEVLPALGQYLHGCSGVVVVFDDVHVLSSDTQRRVLEPLLAYLSPGSQVVFIGRGAPEVHLGRRRLDGQLTEIGIDELAMDVTEAKQMLNIAGVSLDADDLRRLVLRAEGWPTGINLAALAHSRGSRAVAELPSGRDRQLIDYLVEEVLAGLDPETRDFILRSSVLDRMSAELVNDVLETDDAARILSVIERSGSLFLVPMDRSGEWFRYHHIVGEALREVLLSQQPLVARQLRRRACEVLVARGDIDAAIRQSIRAGDSERAADLALTHAVRELNEGRVGELGQWLELLGPAAVERLPAAVVASAWYAIGSADPVLIAAALHAGDRLDSTGPLADGTASFAVAMAVIRLLVAPEGITGVSRDAAIVCHGGGPRVNRWWGFATAMDGTVASLLGDDERAHKLLSDGLVEMSDMPSFEASYLGVLALVEVELGNLEGARLQSRRSMAVCDAHNLENLAYGIPAYAGAALVAAKLGEVAESHRRTEQALVLINRLGHLSPRSALRGYVALAKARLALGEFSDVYEMVRQARRVLLREPDCIGLNSQLEVVAAALAAAGPGSVSITPAEMQVLRCLPSHLSLQEIAGELYISRNTVKSHTVSVYRKLGVGSRANAVTRARELGLLEGGPTAP